MQTLPSLLYANVFVKSSPTMQIPVQLVVPSHTMKAIETKALIDSGASISCIDWGFVRKQRIPTQCLKTLIQARNADNSVNSKGVIRFTTTLFLDIVTLDSDRGKRRLKDNKGTRILEGLLQGTHVLGASAAAL